MNFASITLPLFASIAWVAIPLGCSKKPAPQVSLPSIPKRALKDPSSLAFDGEKFYIADWTSAGLFELGPSGPRFLRAPTPAQNSSRFIQALAIGAGRLIVETDEGKIFLLDTAEESKFPLELHPDINRKPGSLICWDGMYVWLTDNGQAHATSLLPSGELAGHPSLARALAGSSGESGSALSFACGWEASHVLVKEKEDYAIISQSRGREPKKYIWREQDLIPLAIAATGKNTLAALCRRRGREGSFEIIAWTPKGAV
ncbi:MAG: hypothetical protein AAB091_05870 [Elusimicrobiota bacterium]